MVVSRQTLISFGGTVYSVSLEGFSSVRIPLSKDLVQKYVP